MTPDANELQDDIQLLSVLIDSALDNGLDHHVVAAIADVRRSRRGQLEQLEPEAFEYRAA
jgi:hypothetical protein